MDILASGLFPAEPWLSKAQHRALWPLHSCKGLSDPETLPASLVTQFLEESKRLGEGPRKTVAWNASFLRAG